MAYTSVMCSKANRLLDLLCSLKSKLSSACLCSVYTTSVQPVLEYHASTTWAGLLISLCTQFLQSSKYSFKDSNWITKIYFGCTLT